MKLYDYLFKKQPEVIAQLSQTGWKPPTEFCHPGEFVEQELPSSFDYFNRIMREKPRL